ncbi:MAG: M10 family metallopeptidase C-terminal domain-containing protein [Pseudomonadota bacterium]
MCHLCGRLHPGDPAGQGLPDLHVDILGNVATPSSTGSNAPVGSLQEMADYLTMGYWSDLAGRAPNTPVGFDTRASNEITYDISGLTAEGQQLALWAMESWEYVADIRFVAASSDTAQITYFDEGDSAFARSSNSGGYRASTDIYVPQGWIDDGGYGFGSYAFSTYIHEVGHALGLGHMGPYNAGDGPSSYEGTAIFANDSYQMSVMSYFDQVENTTTGATYGEAITPMLADIRAIQDLYGAPVAGPTAGDTDWGGDFPSELGFLELFFNSTTPTSPTWDLYVRRGTYTVFDQGGTDTWNWSGSTQNNYFSMVPGTFSNLYGGVETVAIAHGTIIENALFSGGNDTVIGNDADNFIDGAAGDDSLEGGKGRDTLEGGAGADALRGGNADDSLLGGAGDDSLFGGTRKDVLEGGTGADELLGQRHGDALHGGAGQDTLKGGGGNDLLEGEAGNDFLKGGARVDTLEGGEGRDRLVGNGFGDVLNGGAGNDLLNGGGGDDTLDGGAGDDSLKGGGDSDTFLFGAGADTILDFDVAADLLVLDAALLSGQSLAVYFASDQVTAQEESAEAGAGLLLSFAAGESLLLAELGTDALDALEDRTSLSAFV